MAAAGSSSGQRPQAVLVACGSFNPPTIMHLRMFDLAAHHLRQVCAPCLQPVACTLWVGVGVRVHSRVCLFVAILTQVSEAFGHM